MMKTVVVANNKEGVGKTTIAAHLVFRAAECQLRVLAVDVDAQRNLTSTFLDINKPIDHPGAVNLFYPKPEEPFEPLMLSERLGVAPGTSNLDAVDREDFDVLFRLRESLALLADRFDVCVIDTPPSFNNRFIAALAAANVVVCPMEPATYSLQGVNELFRRVNGVKSHLNHALSFGGLVVNLVNSRSLEQQRVITKLTEAWGPQLISPHLVNRIALSEALAQGRPVWHQPAGKSAKKAGMEFMAMSDKVLKRLGA